MQNDLDRYSCQVNLPGFGIAAQQLLQQAKVLIVGMGGLGCPVSQYLTSSGIGTIGIIDADVVSVSNLHRQILYNETDVGHKKVAIAQQKLHAQNPNINIIAHDIFVDVDNIMALANAYDIVIDCTDNFDAKYLLNDACVMCDKPLIFGAIYQYEGQVSVFNVKSDDGTRNTNYRDIFPDADGSQIPDCAEAGVIPTLAGIIGCMQANEAIKYITGTGELLVNKLLILDALTMQSRIIKTGKITKTNITSLTSTPSISMQELKHKLMTEAIELIDVRTAAEHIAFNIGGKNIPLDELTIKTNQLDTTKTIVCYCATGKRSAAAVKTILASYPLATVLSLQNGIGMQL